MEDYYLIHGCGDDYPVKMSGPYPDEASAVGAWWKFREQCGDTLEDWNAETVWDAFVGDDGVTVGVCLPKERGA